MRNFVLILLIGLLLLTGAAASPFAAAYDRNVSYIPYDEAHPILKALNEALPPELRSAGPDKIATVWKNWVVRRDEEIRARLVQGDEDSLVNFMLFGTAFTRKPRITLKNLSEMNRKDGTANSEFVEAIQSRASDLVKAMAEPGNNERLLFGRRLVESKGYRLNEAGKREQLKDYLLASLSRMLKENAGYAKALESARMSGDASEEFAERSKLYRTRGLSLDTSLPPNFAIEKALEKMKADGLFAASSIRRVAVIGPGLDFTDKQDGYDFYPQQTIQPFALIDALLRLGLAQSGDLTATTFDLSPRVNDHLIRARERARRGAGYAVQLPYDPQWGSELKNYWSRFGEKIGAPASPASVPVGLGEVKVRAVRIKSTVVSMVAPEDVNIVLQRLELPSQEGFDLIVATNILVYYDVFEQSLALANVERMLRPGGFLLSNNALLELPSSRMRSLGYQTAVYSDRPGDGDHIVWYRRSPAK